MRSENRHHCASALTQQPARRSCKAGCIPYIRVRRSPLANAWRVESERRERRKGDREMCVCSLSRPPDSRSEQGPCFASLGTLRKIWISASKLCACGGVFFPPVSLLTDIFFAGGRASSFFVHVQPRWQKTSRTNAMTSLGGGGTCAEHHRTHLFACVYSAMCMMRESAVVRGSLAPEYICTRLYL